MEQVIANGLYLGAQYALVALGLTLIFGLMNVLNFAHGQMYVLGGFITYTIYGQLGLPFVVALAASGLTLAVVGAFMERFLFRTVIKRSLREESTMLLAAATAFFLDAVMLLLFGEKQRGVPKIIKGVFNQAGVILPYDRIVVGLAAILLIAGFILYMKYSRPGRAMRALAQDRMAAQLMGVNVERYTMIGFALGAMLAGLAGGLLVAITGVNSGIGVVRGGASVEHGSVGAQNCRSKFVRGGVFKLHAYTGSSRPGPGGRCIDFRGRRVGAVVGIHR